MKPSDQRSTNSSDAWEITNHFSCAHLRWTKPAYNLHWCHSDTGTRKPRMDPGVEARWTASPNLDTKNLMCPFCPLGQHILGLICCIAQSYKPVGKQLHVRWIRYGFCFQNFNNQMEETGMGANTKCREMYSPKRDGCTWRFQIFHASNWIPSSTPT